MDRRFRHGHEAGTRRLFAELLECRALFTGAPLLETLADDYGPQLSAGSSAGGDAALSFYEAPLVAGESSVNFSSAASLAEAAASTSTAEVLTSPVDTTVVEVVEIGVPDTTGSVVQPIAQSDIPQTIVDAVDSHFPGAELVVAELREDNGSPVYKVQTELEGRPIGVTLTDDGSILDTAYTVAPTELPQPVQDWVEDNFPNSEIGTAELVTQSTGVSYDLLITTETGGFVVATVRLQSVKAPRDLIAVLQKFVGSASPTSVEDAQVPTEEQLATGETPSDAPLELKAVEKSSDRADSAAAAVVDEVDEGETTDDGPTNELAALTAAEQIAFEELAAELEDQPLESIPETFETATLPALTAAIDELLAIDIDAVEQSLRQLLADVDEFVDSVASSTTASGLATRGVLAAAIVAGARVYVLESKRRKLDPVLATSITNSSWGWLLAATTPASQK